MIRVLLFAGLQEKVGKSELCIVADALSVKELKENHLAHYEMEDLLTQAMVAVNEEYATEDTLLADGDVVAFIPPVSGG
jgi:molybdopterin synthase sulfur carrier subunit